MGGGGRPRCPPSGVSTSQARRWHVARHLSLCWGVEHAAWPPSSPFPLCVRSPGAPPAGACTARASFGHGRVVRPAASPRCLPILPLCPREGGPLSAPPFLHSPPLGGRRCVGGVGGLVVFPSLHTCRRHDASTAQARGAAPVSLQGGGGHALRHPSSPFLPCARTPGGPPAGACTARALFGARSCGPSRTLLPLPPYPAALSSGGGVAFRPPPPHPHFPASGGRGWVGGGGGRPCRLPFVARTSQA